MPCPATHPSPRGIRYFRRSRYFGILSGKPYGWGILQPRAQWKHWERVLGLQVFLLSAGWAGNFGPNRHQGWKGKVLRNFWQAVGKIPPESLGIIEFSLEFSASRKLESPEWPYEVVLGKAEHPLGGPEGGAPRGKPGERNSFAKKFYLAQAAAGLPPVDSQNLVFLQVGEINAPRSVSRMIPEAKRNGTSRGMAGTGECF